MIDFNAPSALLTVMAMMQALFCAAWVIFGGRLNLARESAYLWAGFCLCVAVATSLLIHPGSHYIEGVVLVRSVAIVVAALLLRRGIDAFLNLPRHTTEAATIFALVLGGVLIVGLDREAQQARAMLQSAAICWVMLRTVQSRLTPLRVEFGWPTALALGATLAGIGLAFGSFGLAGALGVSRWPVDQTSTFNVGFLATLVLTLAAVNFLLGFMVVARVVQELRWQTRHDVLTGVFNRRAFDYELAREQQLSARRGSPLAVLMIDVDRFKGINDSLGHAAGDVVLIALAKTLAEASRGTDVLGRVGGEEFALILPDTDAQGAALQAERLRQAVQNMVPPEPIHGLRVTVSVGVGDWLPAQGTGESPLQLADRALYLAKAGGRNRVEILVSGQGAG